MAEWRWRCPKGHVTLRRHVRSDSYRCRRCEEIYEGSPVDAQQVDGFPLAEVESDD